MSKASLKNLLDDGLLWCAARQKNCSGANRQQKIPVASLGIAAIDSSLPYAGLPFGCIHEYTLESRCSQSKTEENPQLQKSTSWYPPLFIITALLGNILSSKQQNHGLTKKLIAWVGKRCWPTPHLLETMLSSITSQPPQTAAAEVSSFSAWSWSTNCLFIDPSRKHQRLWSIAQALRCSQTLAVIADGSGFNTAATRRLQLAAKKGGSLGIIIRPPWEFDSPSVAYSKWIVSPFASQKHSLEWSLELLRAKGIASSPPGTEQLDETTELQGIPRKWRVKWDSEKNNGKGSLCIADPRSKEPQYPQAIESAA